MKVNTVKPYDDQKHQKKREYHPDTLKICLF